MRLAGKLDKTKRQLCRAVVPPTALTWAPVLRRIEASHALLIGSQGRRIYAPPASGMLLWSMRGFVPAQRCLAAAVARSLP